MLFVSLVEILEKIRCSTTIRKQYAFQTFFNDAKSLNEDLIGILKLILSTYDSRKFDIGVTKLAFFLSKTFSEQKNDFLEGISKNRTRASQQIAEKLCSDYRSDESSAGVLSISEVNQILDHLSQGSSMDDSTKRQKMKEIVNVCSRIELEWFFNVILKNVESALELNPDKILDWISPNAYLSWQKNHRLEDVLETKIESEKSDDDEHLFKIWTPMLLHKQKRTDWFSDIEKYALPNFFLQTKFDGENMILHKKFNQYRWFSKNNNDFSKEYGQTSMDFGKLSNRIHRFFRDDCETAIFNCELMLWDKKTKQLCRHNDENATSDRNILSFRHIKPDDNQQLTVVLFDLLYHNGTPLFGAPLHQRLKLLKLASLKAEAKESIFIADHVEGTNKKNIMDFFEKAMKNNEEGIVVKKADSQYFKGQRKASNGWFKLKPSASKNCDLDLALISIHPRMGQYGRTVYRFAAFDEKLNKFRVCLSVTNGLSECVREEIKMNCGKLLKKAPVELVDRNGRQMPDLKEEYPGGYVDFEHWQVVNIFSNGVRNGKLVDPVMNRLRDDKLINQCDTFDNFLDYAEKVSNCKLSENESETSLDGTTNSYTTKKSIILTRKMIQKAACSHENPKRAKIESKLTNVEIAILQGTSEKLRRKCENILMWFGAKIVKNPTETTQLVVATAPKANYPKTALAIRDGRCTVVKASWLERCEEKQAVSQWKADEVFNEVENGFRIEE